MMNDLKKMDLELTAESLNGALVKRTNCLFCALVADYRVLFPTLS